LYKELAIQLDQLREQNEVLVKENKLLREANSKLIQEINELKEKLGLNSTNSSLPPSRDLYAIKRKDKAKSDRKPGGQPGHPGYSYQLLPPDEVIDCLAQHCHCGHKLEKTDKFIQDQKIEIPPIKAYVKEYKRWYGYCSACKKKRLAPLPEGVQADLLGPHAKTIITALNGFYHNSKRDLQAIVKDIFNLDISLGLISNTAKRVNKQLEANYQGIKEKITSSPYLHIDETGHKNKGKKGWAWIFTNRETSLLKLSSSRGRQVLKSVLGKYEGQVISDRYGAYTYFEAEKRQICWSHIKRDFERFAHSLNPSLSMKGKRLVELSGEVFGLKKALTRQQVEEDFFLKRIKKIKKELAYIFKCILRIRGIPQGQRVARRILKSFEMLWRFVKDKAIDMTNNLAERQLRKYVTYRKKLFFTWSDWGNEFVERMLSLFLSCRLSNSNAFAQLYSSIRGPS
jgi:transposase